MRGGWSPDGPLVRVEFLRESRDKRITLVLGGRFPLVPSLWCFMAVGTLMEARARLALREGISAHRINLDIGAWSQGDAEVPTIPGLAAWTAAAGVSHVVWTALAPKFGGQAGRVPTVDEVLLHLDGLAGAERDVAEQYVRRTPRQVDTVYRRAIEARLGWTAR
ncbi:MAG: hypothetical protein KA788_07730 [Lacunisphaera sp.]|jgi:hypothetical protein|nr:hypothetical protein [Lacunisphaera sp.]